MYTANGVDKKIMNPQERAEKNKRISQGIDLSRTYPSDEDYDILYDIICNKEKYNGMKIKDTTREERERIVAESLGNISGTCDGCAAGLADMYQDYIDGKRELKEINMSFSARYVSSEADEPDKGNCGYVR